MTTTLDQELALVRSALAARDVSHAAHHLAAAVAEAAGDANVDALVARFAAEQTSLAATAIGGAAFHGTAALRASLLLPTAPDEAVWLLAQAQAGATSAPYRQWIESWTTTDARRFDPTRFAASALHVFAAVACDLADMTFAAWLSAATRVSDAQVDAEDLFLVVCAQTRKSGDVAGALSMAKARVQQKPTAKGMVACAVALKESGEIRAAIAHFRRAIDLDPEFISVLLDIGDLELDEGDRTAARASYQRVLDKEPEHPWALPSVLWLDAEDDSASARERLHALADAGNQRAVQLLSEEGVPGIDFLPPRADAILQLLAPLAEHPGIVVHKINLSSLEAPSAIATFRLVSASLNATSGDLVVAHIPHPDPRDPLVGVDVVLWRFPRVGFLRRRSLEPVPAFGPPTAKAAAAVVDVADSQFDLSAWHQQALKMELSVDDVCGVMLHPPPYPRTCDHLALGDWRFRVQVVAALSLASARKRRVLRSLALGVADWTTTAALIALAADAMEDAEAATTLFDVARMWIETEPCPVRFQCILEPLAAILSTVEDLPEDLGGFVANGGRIE